MKKISLIEVGNVVAGATLVNLDGGVNETHVGHVDIGSQRYKAYIKVLNPKQLVNELLANTLAKVLDLPVPRGFLLKAKPADLPDSVVLKNYTDDVLLFGTQAKKHPSLARRFKCDNVQVLNWIKSNGKSLQDTMVFDDLIANTDRHSGNLLLDDDGQVCLIDHGHSFTGPIWVASDLVPHLEYNNKLVNELIAAMTLPDRISLKDKAGTFVQKMSEVDKAEAMAACYLSNLLDASDLSALELFITERVNHIVSIVSKRVGIPTLGGVV